VQQGVRTRQSMRNPKRLEPTLRSRVNRWNPSLRLRIFCSCFETFTGTEKFVIEVLLRKWFNGQSDIAICIVHASILMRLCRVKIRILPRAPSIPSGYPTLIYLPYSMRTMWHCSKCQVEKKVRFQWHAVLLFLLTMMFWMCVDIAFMGTFVKACTI
jgi:hypothetical protein